MAELDSVLYRWIHRANERREELDLPVGFIEDSIGLLKRTLGPAYLEDLLITNSTPVHFLDDEANPLRKWLLSAMVDSHTVQALELAAYCRVFEDDPSLVGKVEKLKHDSFWPIFFELAMAARMKRACRGPQQVNLNPETPTSVGDFTITVPGYEIPCECTRLGNSPQITAPQALEESLSNRISDGTKNISAPLCIKIRSLEPLNGITYIRILQLVRKGLQDARRSRIPARHTDGSTTVDLDHLTESSEKIPFRVIAEKIENVTGADWHSAASLCRVPARGTPEIADRFEKGERFHEYEAVRVFMNFGTPVDETDCYARLTAKLKKKLKQTKTSSQHFGKVVLLEVPFNLRTLDDSKLKEAIRQAAFQSRTALAIVLGNREANPHIRHHYSLSASFNQVAAVLNPDVLALLSRFACQDVSVDPILGSVFRRSWAEAVVHVRKVTKPAPQ